MVGPTNISTCGLSAKSAIQEDTMKTSSMKFNDVKILPPIQALVTDGRRHLVCLPYSIPNLHLMARQLLLGKHWFHKDHYDIPVNRRQEIERLALHVSPKVITRLTRGIRKHHMVDVPRSRGHSVSQVYRARQDRCAFLPRLGLHGDPRQIA